MSIKGSKYITIIYAKIKNCGPLHIGTGEEDILLEEESGLPYIPATSIAGVFRAYLMENEDDNTVKMYFGNGGENSTRSRIFFYDAVSDKIELELRPSLKINKRTGAAEKKQKFDRQFLGEGHEFDIRIELFSKNDKENNELKNNIYKCLKAIRNKHINLGGYKTSGAGEFDLLKVEEVEYNLQDAVSLFDYLNRVEKRKDITKVVESTKLSDNYIEFSLICDIDKPILIKGLNSNESGQADSVNIRNKDAYIIPGSSLKGVLRAQAGKINNYFNKSNELIEAVFGNESQDKEKKIAGRVYVSDAVIENAKDKINYNRIKIDKFTGGTIAGAKFVDKPIVGSAKLEIKYKKTKDKEKDKAVIGMLLLTLRDIAIGNVPLGSGSNVGRGRINCKTMKMYYEDNVIEINFSKKTISDERLVNTFIKSFAE